MSVLEKYIAYKLVSKLAQPFTEWDAFKVGLIDADGNKLRNPVGDVESNMFSDLNNVARNLKRLLTKYTGLSAKLGAILIGSALFKECPELAGDPEVVEDIKTALIAAHIGPVEVSESVAISDTPMPSGRYFVHDLLHGKDVVSYLPIALAPEMNGMFKFRDTLGNHVLSTKELVRKL